MFQKISSVEKNYKEKRWGVLFFSVRNYLSHSAEKFLRRALLCCVSENFRYRKSLWIRGRGSIKIFRRKFFVSRCRKIS